MSGSAIFDVAIGIVFVFLLVSLICSQISDRISLWLRWRARDLEAGLRSFVMGDKYQVYVDKLYENTLVQSLVPKDMAVTQYLKKTPLSKLVYPGANPLGIPAKTFALALLDSVLPPLPKDEVKDKDKEEGEKKDDVKVDVAFDELKRRVDKLPDNMPLKSSLLSICKTANHNLETARGNIEDWYDSAMSRSTVIYQRNMWGFSFLIGAIIALLLNVDIIAVGTNLWRDSALRTSVASAAAKYATDNNQQKADAEINSINLPIGWQIMTASADRLSIFGKLLVPIDWVKRTSEQPVGPGDYILKISGWLITALAAAQGAPFWFDLLRKLTQKG